MAPREPAGNNPAVRLEHALNVVEPLRSPSYNHHREALLDFCSHKWKALLDLRFRKALAHAFDTEGAVEAKMILSRAFGATALVGIVLTGCVRPDGPSSAGEKRASQGEAQPGRTLVVATRGEPPSLSPRPFRALGLTAGLSATMFNAHLTLRNDDGLPVPDLAEGVPQLNSDSWRVFPDGTMETSYRLRPNLVWHDGQPLIGDDFIFAYRIFADPEFALSVSPPTSLIDRVTAPDPRTVVVHWKQTYPWADGMGQTGGTAVPPLPKHLLAEAYESQDAEAFMANSFWTQGYIGAGPYKLKRWEPGAFLEGVAFDQHVLGKPKIPRIRELFIGDPNTVIANILAGEVHLTSGDSIRFTDGETLRERLGDRGQVLNEYNLYRMVQFQRRPEYASTLAFTDLRVRKALHHGVDFAALNAALQGGRTTAAYGPIPPTKRYYPQLEKVVSKYPYDPRKSEQLMTEAGFSKGFEGVWVHADPRFGQMSFETNVFASPDSNNEMSIMADAWRRLGFDVKEVSWAPAVAQDRATRNTFSGLSTTSTGFGETALTEYHTRNLPTPERRWAGTNRGAWPGTREYDRLVEAFETSLDPDKRTQAIIQMARILTDEVVVINLYWKLNAVGFVNGLTGPRITDPDGSAAWDLHEWEFR